MNSLQHPNVVSDAATLLGETLASLPADHPLRGRIKDWQSGYRETIELGNQVARGQRYDAWLRKRDGEPTVTFQGGDPLGGPCARIYGALLAGERWQAEQEMDQLYGWAGQIEALDKADPKIVSIYSAANELDEYYIELNAPYGDVPNHRTDYESKLPDRMPASEAV